MPAAVTRDTRLDGMKFVLIFLVILGHISYYDYGIRVNRFIYAFHMPMFVMISGYLTHPQSFARFKRSSLKLLALYLIFQTGHLVYNNLFRGIPFTLEAYMDPALALWYLLCLIYWRCAYHLLRPLGVKPVYALLISIILSALAGFIPLGNDSLGFQRAFSFLPFFVFGLMLKDKSLVNKINQLNIPLMVVLLLLALVSARLLPNFMPRSPYFVWKESIFRLIQSVIAFVICMGMIRFFPRRVPGLISLLGQWTLYYYLYHTFMVKGLADIMKHYHFDLNIFSALLLSSVIVLIITAMHRVKLFRILLLER